MDTDVNFGPDGLIPAIVQDAKNHEVLMLGYMNQESLQLTLSTDKVHFFSRSRSELWLKGGTSGNFLKLDSIVLDCDADALLVKVFPEGPVCHTGEQSCFDNHPPLERS